MYLDIQNIQLSTGSSTAVLRFYNNTLHKHFTIYLVNSGLLVNRYYRHFHITLNATAKLYSKSPHLASNNCLKHILFNAVQTFGEFSIPDMQMKSKMKDAIRLLLILMYYHCVSRNILTFIVKVQSVNHTLDAFIVDNMVEEAL